MAIDRVPSVPLAAHQGPLTHTERTRLRELTAIVRRGVRAFIEVGQALMEVQQARLYRATHGTFEAYCRRQLEISSSHAYSLIAAARVAGQLVAGGLPAPHEHAQARALLALPEEGRLTVWDMAVKEADGKQPVATRVAELAAVVKHVSLPDLVRHEESEAALVGPKEQALREQASLLARKERGAHAILRASRACRKAGWEDLAMALEALSARARVRCAKRETA